jgi:hypothetical protein
MKAIYLYNVGVRLVNPPSNGVWPLQPQFYAESLEKAIEKAKDYYKTIGYEVEIISANAVCGVPVVF